MERITARKRANAIRFLSIDAVEKAKSGHPGMPMGMADIAEVLWSDFIHVNPQKPDWVNRDRFVLSNGHGSMLLYSLLFLTGFELSLDDLKHFRSLHSKTPGHPEYGITPGVETTTGPLGQGFANAVGFVIAQKKLAAEFNRPGFPILSHKTYVFLGDGCLMEGVSHEAASLAGTLKLNQLIAFWDDNGISIDGHVEGWFTDNTQKRFEAYGWNVIADVDGHDSESIRRAIEKAKLEQERPTLICCKTTIGFGAPHHAGTADVHGAPLGSEEAQGTREALDWPYPPFEIPAEILESWRFKTERLSKKYEEWQSLWSDYEAQHPDLAVAFQKRFSEQKTDIDFDIESSLHTWQTEKTAPMATRKASQAALELLLPLCPAMIGGSADLTGSNLTAVASSKTITPADFSGNYLCYGVREFGMAAIMNGLALYGGLIPYGGTFLVFSDYARNAIRLSALMQTHVIYVLTHDSIGLGEDGPTHQPIEHLASLRLIPGLNVYRPADHVETLACFWQALTHKGPSVLALSRQNLPLIAKDKNTLQQIQCGGYIVKTAEHPDLILVATGSEVQLALEAYERLSQEGLKARLVSMPCYERFKQQPATYQEAVLPKNIRKRVVVEAGATQGWYEVAGLDGCVVGLDRFGESAPASHIYSALHLTSDDIVSVARSLL